MDGWTEQQSSESANVRHHRQLYWEYQETVTTISCRWLQRRESSKAFREANIMHVWGQQFVVFAGSSSVRCYTLLCLPLWRFWFCNHALKMNAPAFPLLPYSALSSDPDFADLGIPPPLPCRYTPSHPLSAFFFSLLFLHLFSFSVSLKSIYSVLLPLIYIFARVYVQYLWIHVCLRESPVCACVHLGVYTHVCVSACQYDMVGPEGIVESHQITRDGKAGAAEAVDCKWYIRAPPRSKVSDVSFAPVKLCTWFEATLPNVTWNKMEMKFHPH